MSSHTKKILKGIVTMNPLISPVGCCRGYRKIVEKGKKKRRQTETLTVAAAWQLMSSQFNHHAGSWGSGKFICISLNGERLFGVGRQNGIGRRKGREKKRENGGARY